MPIKQPMISITDLFGFDDSPADSTSLPSQFKVSGTLTNLSFAGSVFGVVTDDSGTQIGTTASTTANPSWKDLKFDFSGLSVSGHSYTLTVSYPDSIIVDPTPTTTSSMPITFS